MRTETEMQRSQSSVDISIPGRGVFMVMIAALSMKKKCRTKREAEKKKTMGLEEELMVIIKPGTKKLAGSIIVQKDAETEINVILSMKKEEGQTTEEVIDLEKEITLTSNL